MSVLYPSVDPDERFRARRAAARRRRRLRYVASTGASLALLTLVVAGASVVRGHSEVVAGAAPGAVSSASAPDPSGQRPMPIEIRGVHVSLGLASLPGKLEEYLALRREGLTALELDVKDESGQIGFMPQGVELARDVGAAAEYYDPAAAARLAHARDVYLIGRVVVFEDPVLASQRSELAVRRADGAVWRDAAGFAWTNPYDRRVWAYNVGIAAAAARRGFDEILFDYVRFPSDGDVASATYQGRRGIARDDAVPAFLRYAARRLEPLGVRVSTTVFGLAASQDLGVGQRPRRMARHVDAIYPMTYPSLFGPGALGLDDPATAPGATVAEALADLRRAVAGVDVLIIPWVQDFTFTQPYRLPEVRAQERAARHAGAKGFMLWNAEGVYTEGALRPAPGIP